MFLRSELSILVTELFVMDGFDDHALPLPVAQLKGVPGLLSGMAMTPLSSNLISHKSLGGRDSYISIMSDLMYLLSGLMLKKVGLLPTMLGYGSKLKAFIRLDLQL